mgnify:CR=1 FL=1
MPGMAASPKIFEFLDLQNPFEIHLLSWFPPKQNESLGSYAKRMCKKVIHKNPILMGVSFGGVLIQEMAKHIKVRKIVIISSIKNNIEFGNPYSSIDDITNAAKLAEVDLEIEKFFGRKKTPKNSPE